MNDDSSVKARGESYEKASVVVLCLFFCVAPWLGMRDILAESGGLCQVGCAKWKYWLGTREILAESPSGLSVRVRHQVESGLRGLPLV